MPVQLPSPLTHRFTPDESPTWQIIEPVLDRLEAMPLDTPTALEAFLGAWNELNCWVMDDVAKSRVVSRARINDEQAQARWKTLSSTVLPDLSLRTERLNRKLLASPLVDALEGGPYASFVRQSRVEVRLFCDANVELEERESELITAYRRLSGSWAFDFDGEERTLSQMHRYLAAPEREIREAAWRCISATLAQTADEAEALFEALFELRHEIARNAGFDSYREYIFVKKLREYGPDACDALAEAVRSEVLPLLDEIARDNARRLRLRTFRPWDGNAQPDGSDPLAPFTDTERLKDGVERMMQRLDPELGDRFACIRDNMDLDSRPNKGQGGFMTWFFWDRRPFIFMNASGSHRDLTVLLHECGHAMHWLLANESGSRPMDTVVSAKEFAEVASMSMELLHYDTLDEFYGPEDRARAIAEHLRRIPLSLAMVAQGDQFQQWLYTHPRHTRAERRAKWQELEQQHSPHIDYAGIDDADIQNRYHIIFHFFTIPFYFIEYGFAQLGALRVAMNAERDWESGLAAYKSALALGPQRDVRGLFEAAGAEFEPTTESVGEAMGWVRKRLRDATTSDA